MINCHFYLILFSFWIISCFSLCFSSVFLVNALILSLSLFVISFFVYNFSFYSIGTGFVPTIESLDSTFSSYFSSWTYLGLNFLIFFFFFSQKIHFTLFLVWNDFQLFKIKQYMKCMKKQKITFYPRKVILIFMMNFVSEKFTNM